MSGAAFFAAISGLRANQTRLDVVANNIANLNTYGFKGSRVTFADLLSQTIRAASSPQGNRGGINPVQVGLGVQIASIDNLMSQGSVQNTGNTRDLAIDGDGFFILESDAGQTYTRAGNFNIDFTGRLVTVTGERIQGFSDVTPDGTQIDPSSPLGDIVINFGEKIPAHATTEVSYRSNLDATSDTFGTAELVAAGSTGFTLAAGIASPLAAFRGQTVTSGPPIPNSAVGDLVIDGQDVSIVWPLGFNFADAEAIAEFVVDAINAQVPTVYARVTGNAQIEIESLFGNGNSINIAGTPGFLTTLGLAAGTYTEPVQSAAQAGVYNITVREATAAETTTARPVQAGLLPLETFTLNGVAITYGPTSAANTAAQNAQIIADAINATTDLALPAGSRVQATANANGTLSLKNTLAGVENRIIVDAGLTTISGLDTIGTLTTPPPFPSTALSAYVVENGTDAFVTADFESEDGSVSRGRTFFDRSVYGSASALSNLEPFILGDNAPLPLIPGVTLTATDLRNGQARVTTADAFTHATNIEVFDSAGVPHNLVLEFEHFDQNQWKWTATLPAEPHISVTNNTGFIDFGTDGLNATVNPLIPVSFTPPGAETVDLQLLFDGNGDPLEGVTQFAGSTTTRANFQDGFPLGVLRSFAFDPNGTIQGTFSNGLSRPLAQIALANFNNPSGLLRLGNNNWAVTANSGTVSINRPGTGGAGGIIPGALEQSNVDLASEFTDLIIGQRGFQANTRVITTQDQILGEVVNLVR